MNRGAILLIACLVILGFVIVRTVQINALDAPRGIRVALVYTPADVNASVPNSLLAFSEALRESGIPFDTVASTDISLLGPKELRRDYSALLFTDGVNQRVPEETTGALASYANAGGRIAIVADAGSRSTNGFYRPASLFATISGVDATLYQTLRNKAYTSGPLHFTNVGQSQRWDVPSGKLVDGNLSSYGYGALRYPFARAQLDRPGSGVEVSAQGRDSPMLAQRTIGAGSVAYLALPIGYLRTHSDAFPMSFITSFLRASHDLPHLIAAPNGIGELIVDMHIDSAVEFSGIPNLKRRGLLRKDVRMEFDVTAGPDRDRQGDRLGFDACGRGKKYLKMLMPYGRIGSHGGWAHNEFAAKVSAGDYSVDQIKSLIARNDRCLESVTHQRVLSFAAPVGVHPQPTMTRALDELGITSYYYTGDTGAPVERPFYDGTLVSQKSWAFPVMPLGDIASLGEMNRDGVPASVVQNWLQSTADFASTRRGIYLLYSHSYDLKRPDYARAFGKFLRHVEHAQRTGTLHTTDMPTAAAFMERYIQTKPTFQRSSNGGTHVYLTNPVGLHSIAFGVPSTWVAHSAAIPAGVKRAGTGDGYDIFTVTDNRTVLDITLPGGSS